MSGTLSHLIAVAEQYPMLKASENFHNIAKPVGRDREPHQRGPREVQRPGCAITTRG